MFKKIIVAIILFALTFQCLGSLGVLAWFGANRSYIALNLCENRDKPYLHCNGQCVLMKKLKKMQESRDEKHTAPEFSKTELAVVLSRPLILPALAPQPLTRVLPPYCLIYSYRFIASIFLPPKYS